MPLTDFRRSVRWWAGKPVGLVISIRAFFWARSELKRMERTLPAKGISTRATPPAGLAPRGHRGLNLALMRVSPTCLERALVLQAWVGAYMDAPDVVIGVRKGESAVEAHAWVDQIDDPWFDPTYAEITRLTP